MSPAAAATGSSLHITNNSANIATAVSTETHRSGPPPSGTDGTCVPSTGPSSPSRTTRASGSPAWSGRRLPARPGPEETERVDRKGPSGSLGEQVLAAAYTFTSPAEINDAKLRQDSQ
jgi:hypothetical protein